MADKKLLVIGWDAADWQVIEPLLQQGKMPTLERLVHGGVKGNIATLNPPLSPMLWTSIATGKRAYDHGIHGFVEVDKLTGNICPVRATTRKSKTIWNILNEAGLKTNVVNWWPSHPVEKLNGAMVSNQFHKEAPAFGEKWPLEKPAIYPEQLYQHLKDLRLHPAELTLQHIIPFIPQAATLDPENDGVLKPLMRVLAHCVSVHNAATYLMENTEWNFMAVYYETIDHFSHLAMKYHPPRLENIDEKEYELYKGIVEAAYRYHDMMLDRLLSLAGDDCNVLLVSDHGFESSGLREAKLPDVPAAPALEHRKYGIFAARGPAFNRGKQIFGSSLLDIAPTILHYFGLPVGQDMEGQVLKDIFKNYGEVGAIPSWEATGQHPQFVDEDASSAAGLLDQLEELGYINLQTENKQAYVESELSYNLCVSLLDGNRLVQAKEVAERYFKKNGEERFALLLAMALLRLGEGDELQRHLAVIQKNFPRQVAVQYFKGLLALHRGKVVEALKNFRELEIRGIASLSLMLEIGRALLIAGRVNDALGYYKKCLKLDSENAEALTGKAQCLLEKGRAEEALDDLERSLQQRFYQPNAHYLMAQAAQKLDFEDIAQKALKICLEQAPKHKAAANMLATFSGNANLAKPKPVTIVSGFPRSGTSMLMKMLKQAGLVVYEDELRKEDEHNPAGYFEHRNVKDLGLRNDWLPEAREKTVKVVSPLLRYLPQTERYKIIWIKRPLTEVILSQEVMRGKSREEVMRNFPFQMAMDMQQEDVRLTNWLEMQPNINFFTVQYYDCLERPSEVLQAVGDFLEAKLDIEKGIEAVRKNLHRNKLGK